MTSLLSQPALFILSLLVLFFSIILHEVAHGWTAEKLGDPTARLSGRITFNPIPHVDLFGTILLPLTLILLGSTFVIGWAKPVPVHFYRLRHLRRDSILVSISGIVANLTVALLASLIWRILVLLHLTGSTYFFIAQLLYYTIGLNLLLALFNLIPIPPLDGSKILGSLLPARTAAFIFDPRFSFYGTLILFLLLGTGLLWQLLDPAMYFFLSLLGP